MFTDVFYKRYANFHLKDGFDPSDVAFLVQGHRLLVEQLFPYWSQTGNEVKTSVEALKRIHDSLSIEIGVHELSPRYYSYPNASGQTISGSWGYDYVLRNYLCAPFQEAFDVTTFLMRRISLLELGFQLRENQVVQENANFSRQLIEAKRERSVGYGTRLMLPGDPTDWIKSQNEIVNANFNANVQELNVRFREAGYPFHYHNGVIQISRDVLTLGQVEKPFWDIVADPVWRNVDIDMQNAIDLRDNNGPNPVFHAAKALESTIKIISEQKGANNGKEKGAHNYIDNLRSERAGRFIEQWEADALKSVFTDIRNPHGHGPGPAPMPLLNPQQTDWVIENCMSWIKSLVRRL
jgi:AbiJ N-terminal domain 4